MPIKYTKEKLESVVRKSISIQDIARAFIGKPVTGNQHQHIKKMILKYGIDTSHFLGQRHGLGTTSNQRKNPEQIFTVGQRQRSYYLRRALIESGIKYECIICGINSWKEKKLNLEVDHIDGNSTDNSKENLRFLCPNCHSQTHTFGYKGNRKHI